MEFAKPPIDASAAPATLNDDLSAEIAKAVERLPNDIIRCVRVTGNRYRCNWWSADIAVGYDNPMMRAGQIGATHRIRQSQFLDATRTPAGLQMRVIPDPR